MTNKTIIKFLVFTFLILNVYQANAFVKPALDSQTKVESVFELPAEVLLKKDKKDLEKIIGRKLTFKEKLGLPLVKKKLKNHAKLSSAEEIDSRRTDGFAITGFVLGIVGLLLAGGLIISPLAIVFSAIAMGRIRRKPESLSGRGLAIAGLILGIVGSVFTVFFILALAFA